MAKPKLLIVEDDEGLCSQYRWAFPAWITPYLPLDRGGPPGQTSPPKLACLCRRHHRAKTTRHWHYVRNKDGTYTWHGPHHQTYLVTSSGTTTSPRA